MKKDLQLGKPFKNKIGGRELITVKLYENEVFLDKDYKEEKTLVGEWYINIDINDPEKPQVWIKEKKEKPDVVNGTKL